MIQPKVLFIDARDESTRQDNKTLVMRAEKGDTQACFDQRVKEKAEQCARNYGATVYVMETTGSYAVPVLYKEKS